MPEKRSERKSIWVYIKLDGEGFASSPEFDLRYELEDAIEERGIGNLEGAGSGGGWMDVSFGVENIDAVGTALLSVKNLLEEYKVPQEVYRFDITDCYDPVCEETPDFQASDCLQYRFDDGDYGAAIVLKRKTDEIQPDIQPGWQTGMPPASDNSDQILLGILDYKDQNPPQPAIFEQRNWLIRTHESQAGQPFLVWVDCFGGIQINLVHHITLSHDDPMECRFHLSWEDIPEYFIRDKYRGNSTLNPYETIEQRVPNYQPGDCLSYRFDNGDFGAALVVKRFYDGTNRSETLIGILDYKHPTPPDKDTFERRKWLLSNQAWREGQPYLVIAGYCWSLTCEGLEVDVIDHIALKADDPTFSPFCLFWEQIPEFVLHEMKMAKHN